MQTVTFNCSHEPSQLTKSWNTHKGGEESSRGSIDFMANDRGSIAPKRVRGFKPLTDVEFQEKLEKRLYFRCNKKFSPSHTCRNCQLQVLLLSQDDEEGRPLDQSTKEEHSTLQANQIKLSLTIISGISLGKTMKLKGVIQGQEVIELVDRDASHNFISNTQVEKLKLKVEPTKGF